MEQRAIQEKRGQWWVSGEFVFGFFFKFDMRKEAPSKTHQVIPTLNFVWVMVKEQRICVMVDGYSY
jgi:hypothetical protein